MNEDGSVNYSVIPAYYALLKRERITGAFTTDFLGRATDRKPG
jgi:hypothetical protein